MYLRQERRRVAERRVESSLIMIGRATNNGAENRTKPIHHVMGRFEEASVVKLITLRRKYLLLSFYYPDKPRCTTEEEIFARGSPRSPP
jgi:hypothetical protein